MVNPKRTAVPNDEAMKGLRLIIVAALVVWCARFAIDIHMLYQHRKIAFASDDEKAQVAAERVGVIAGVLIVMQIALTLAPSSPVVRVARIVVGIGFFALLVYVWSEMRRLPGERSDDAFVAIRVVIFAIVVGLVAYLEHTNTPIGEWWHERTRGYASQRQMPQY